MADTIEMQSWSVRPASKSPESVASNVSSPKRDANCEQTSSTPVSVSPSRNDNREMRSRMRRSLVALNVTTTRNVSHLCTITGILQMIELALGVICLSLFGHYSTKYEIVEDDLMPPTFTAMSRELFFMLTLFFALMTTLILMFTSIICLETAKSLSKSIFPLVYNSVTFVFLLSSTISVLMLYAFPATEFLRNEKFNAKQATCVLGLLLSIAYLLSAVRDCVVYHEIKDVEMTYLIDNSNYERNSQVTE